MANLQERDFVRDKGEPGSLGVVVRIWSNNETVQVLWARGALAPVIRNNLVAELVKIPAPIVKVYYAADKIISVGSKVVMITGKEWSVVAFCTSPENETLAVIRRTIDGVGVTTDVYPAHNLRLVVPPEDDIVAHIARCNAADAVVILDQKNPTRGKILSTVQWNGSSFAVVAWEGTSRLSTILYTLLCPVEEKREKETTPVDPSFTAIKNLRDSARKALVAYGGYLPPEMREELSRVTEKIKEYYNF